LLIRSPSRSSSPTSNTNQQTQTNKHKPTNTHQQHKQQHKKQGIKLRLSVTKKHGLTPVAERITVKPGFDFSKAVEKVRKEKETKLESKEGQEKKKTKEKRKENGRERPHTLEFQRQTSPQTTQSFATTTPPNTHTHTHKHKKTQAIERGSTRRKDSRERAAMLRYRVQQALLDPDLERRLANDMALPIEFVRHGVPDVMALFPALSPALAPFGVGTGVWPARAAAARAPAQALAPAPALPPAPAPAAASAPQATTSAAGAAAVAAAGAAAAVHACAPALAAVVTAVAPRGRGGGASPPARSVAGRKRAASIGGSGGQGRGVRPRPGASLSLATPASATVPAAAPSPALALALVHAPAPAPVPVPAPAHVFASIRVAGASRSRPDITDGAEVARTMRELADVRADIEIGDYFFALPRKSRAFTYPLVQAHGFGAFGACIMSGAHGGPDLHVAVPDPSMFCSLVVACAKAGQLASIAAPHLPNRSIMMRGEHAFALSMGLGEAFSTVARFEHPCPASSSPAEEAARAARYAADRASGSAVLTVWLEPGRSVVVGSGGGGGADDRAEEEAVASAGASDAAFVLVNRQLPRRKFALQHGTALLSWGGSQYVVQNRYVGSNPPPMTLVELKFYLSKSVLAFCRADPDFFVHCVMEEWRRRRTNFGMSST
jgi:hypothetical protein